MYCNIGVSVGYSRCHEARGVSVGGAFPADESGLCQGVQGAARCWTGDAGQFDDLTSASAVLGHVPGLVHEHGLQWQTSQ